VRRLLLPFLLIAVALAPTASPGTNTHVLRAAGLAVVAPSSWHLTREHLSDCSSPKQVLAFTDARAGLGTEAKLAPDETLVLLLEDDGYVGTGFPPRKEFRVPARLDGMGGCCEMPFSRGFELVFRDHGRNFYGFVYAATRANAGRAAAILNTLRVS
jgi:hypothetical protein